MPIAARSIARIPPVVEFANEIQRRTNELYKVQHSLSGSRGGERESTEEIHLGTQELTLTDQLYASAAWLMNRVAFKKLTASDKRRFIQAANESTKTNRASVAADDAKGGPTFAPRPCR